MMLALRHLWTGWRRGLSGTTLAARYGGVDLTSLTSISGTAIADQIGVGQSLVSVGSQPQPTTGNVYALTIGKPTTLTTSAFYPRYISGTSNVRLRIRWASGDWILDHNSGSVVQLATGPIPAEATSVNIVVRDSGSAIVVHVGSETSGEVATSVASVSTAIAFLTSTAGTGDFTGIYRTVLAQVGGLSGCADFAFRTAFGSGVNLSGAHAIVMRRRQQVSGFPRGEVALLTASNYAVSIHDNSGSIKPQFQTASGQVYTPASGLISPSTSPYLICCATTGTETQLAALASSAVPTLHTAARTLGTPGTAITLAGTSGYDELLELAILNGVPTAAEIKTLYDTADWATFVPATAGGNQALLLTEVG